MKSKSLKKSLMIICFVMALVASLTIAGISIYNIKSTTNLAGTKYKNAMNDGYNTEIKSQCQSVIAILKAEYEKVGKGLLTEAQAKEEAKAIIRTMRYRDDGSGYFWIDSTDYTLVMHPILAKNEGTNRYTLQDQNGIMIIQSIMNTVKGADKAGYNEFYFTKADGVTVAPKMAYSQLFEPWGWVVSTGNYVDDMQEIMSQTEKEISDKFVTMCMVIAAATAVIALIVLIVSRYFGNRIVNPLVKIQNFATRLSEGDLTTPVDVKEQNEIGKTAIALNHAQANITELISSITGAAADIDSAISEFGKSFGSMNGSIQEVSKSVTSIAENISGQADSTGNATDSVNRIARSIENTTKEVQELELNSNSMKNLSQQSVDALDRMLDVNNRTRDDISTMYSQTEITNKSIQHISQAADLINDVSSQTNLLSLNASIEAARAGEAGKGFAVVAQEIGKLAEESSAAANEIGKVIKEVLGNSSKSVTIMEGMNATIGYQVETLNNTQKIFDSLHENIDKSIRSVDLISGMTADTENQKDNVNKNLEILNHLAQDNAAATEETSAMTQELASLVELSNTTVESLSGDVSTLMEHVNKFRLS